MTINSSETLKLSSFWGLSSVLTLGFVVALSGCTIETQPVVATGGVYAEAGPAPVADDTVYPPAPPPDAIPESPPPAPGPGYAWAAGYWDWTGSEWSWNNGYWAPQEPGYVYFGPRFEFIEGRAVYHRAYWQGPGGRRDYRYGGRGAPPAAWRARPASDPVAWRGEAAHNQGWHGAPGAEKYHGAATPSREPERGPENHAQPVATEPARTEPAHTEPARTEPARTGPAHTDSEQALERGASKPPSAEAEHRTTERPAPGNAVAAQPVEHASAAAKGVKRATPGKKAANPPGEKKKE